MLILGIGAFKPNISTQVGALYAPGDHRRDRAYSIFYVGINIGAFLAPLVCGTLAVQYGWHYGFARRRRRHAGEPRHLSLRPRDAAGRTTGAASEGGRRASAKPLDAGERRAVLALIGVCALVTLFWAAYDQQGNTILLWAEDFTDRSIDLWFWRGEIPSPWFLALNPLMIFVLTPLIVRLWARQGQRGTEPLPVSKMAFGCLCVALANLVMAAAAWTAAGKASALWLVGYFVARDHRRAASCAGRARTDLEARPRAHALDDDGRLVRDHAARRHSRRLPRRLLEQHGQAEFLSDDRVDRRARERRHVGVPESSPVIRQCALILTADY